MNDRSLPVLTRMIRPLLTASCAAAVSSVVLAQPAPQQAAPTITELTVVNAPQSGNPPSGPFAVVVEHDPGLATHTIYRPANLSMDKHPVLVWGEGGCAKNGLMFPEFLAEVASHGFVVIADGPPGSPGAGAGGPNGPAARGGGAPGGARAGGAGGPGGARAGGPGGPGGPGGARAGGPGGPGGPGAARAGGPGGAGGARAGGPGGGRAGGAGGGMVNGTDLIAAVNWIEKEAARDGSRFYGKVDANNVAAMGMSCGGLMS